MNIFRKSELDQDPKTRIFILYCKRRFSTTHTGIPVEVYRFTGTILITFESLDSNTTDSLLGNMRVLENLSDTALSPSMTMIWMDAMNINSFEDIWGMNNSHCAIDMSLLDGKWTNGGRS
jgi:hypothetical protein